MIGIAQPSGGHCGGGFALHHAWNALNDVVDTAVSEQPEQHAYVCGGESSNVSLVSVQSSVV